MPRLLLGTSADTRRLAVDGTVVLVDISGFTVLSERLAAAGRQGTEELIATLSRVFTVLLSATDDGGDVLKFAGDALLVLYSGPAHERRAAHSAWVMQRVLAAIGDIRLRTAAARLRMSVGVHTGRFDVVLTGEQSRNAVIVGGDTAHVLRLQATAGAGRILVSAKTADALTPGQVRIEQPGPMGRRLTGAGAVAAESLMALRDVAREDADVFLPRAFLERPDLLAAEPDHRWAAVGFASISGLPDVIDDAVVAEIDRLTRVVEEAVEVTGATLLDIDPTPGGFRYFLTAGAPRAIEDPEGSLLAALHRIVSADTPYSVKAGAASGRVFAGFVGAPFRKTYTTMGDATNLAARLTSHASEGMLVAARACADRARAQLAVGPTQTITVKGKSRPIAIVPVTAVGARRRAERGEVPFCGRRDDRARLSELLGAGGAVTITGAPGIGKSALAEHMVADLPVVRVVGDRFAARTAYGTMRALLRPLLDIAADTAPAEAGRALEAWLRRSAPDLTEWAALLADMIGAECRPSAAVRALDDAYRAERAQAVLGELLAGVLASDVVVMVDDAQWVDSASSAALGSALSGAARRSLIVRRAGDEGLHLEGSVLEVQPLDDEDAATLIETVLGRSPHPGDLIRILRRAEGNPLYLVELAGAIDEGEEPRTLDELIGERIDALSESDRHHVRAAAVLGLRVPSALFARCVGAIDLDEGTALGELLRIDADGAGEYVVFRSELYREVAYDQLAFQDRRRLHRAAAEAITADPELAAGAADAMLTVHFEATGDWESMAAAARRGAEVAERAFAMEDAVIEYRAAITASRRARAPRATLRELCEALGRVAYRCGRTAESLDVLEEARRLADSPVDRARIDCERAHGLNHLGRPADAAAALRRARRAARAAGSAGRAIEARILVVDGAMRMRQSRWAELLNLSRQAITLLDGQADSAEEKAVLADAYRYHDIAASELEGDEAMVHLQQALELYEELGDALSSSKVLTLIGIRAYYRGAWSTAASLYARAEAASEAAGYTVGAALDAANTAEILIDQGKVDLARPLLRRAARVAEAAADAWMIASVEGFAGRAHLRDGDPAAARESFGSASAALEELGETESVLDIQVRRIQALIDLGDHDAARAAAPEIASAVGDGGILASQLLRHRARLAQFDGDHRQALALSRAAVDAAGSMLYERALALALVAEFSGAERSLLRAEAETILGELGVVDIPRLLGETADTARSDPVESPLPPERGRPR